MSYVNMDYGPTADRARRLLRRRRAWFWVFWLTATLILLLAAGGGLAVLAYRNAEPRGVQLVKMLGGRVRWTNDRPKNGHVVGITLSVSTLRDDDLAQLTPWWWTFPELKDLDLSGAGITDAGLAHLRGAELRSLTLDGTQVSGDGLRHVAVISDLRSLSLNNTQAGDDGLEHIARLPQLGALYLRGTPITDSGLQHLEGLISLRYLQLGGNRGITDAGVNRLTAALPELRVSRE
jgi:hypothetical protein